VELFVIQWVLLASVCIVLIYLFAVGRNEGNILLLLLNLQVGTFDPYSDDPRLAVKKVALCPMSGTLVVAGTAGSVIVSRINSDSVEKEVKVLAHLGNLHVHMLLAVVRCNFALYWLTCKIALKFSYAE
jgi:hypothetical protein